MNLRLLTLLTAVAALSACAHRLIPGTDIADNEDTRAILGVVEQYRAALEAKDANRIIELVDPSYRDSGGNSDPADDLDYATLKRTIPQRLAKLEDVKIDLSVRKITLDHETANVIYYFNSHYRLPRYTGKVLNEGDLQQMWLKKSDGKWKIITGA